MLSRITTITTLLSILFTTVLLVTPLMAQVEPPVAVTDRGKLLLLGSMNFGGGFDSHELFETTEGDKVTLSGGGGIGIQVAAGYRFTPAMQGVVGMEYMFSSLSQTLSNAEGTFERTILSFGIHREWPHRNTNSIVAGGGMGIYSGGLMDVDATEIEGGGHNKYAYDSATGFHGQVEYRIPLPKYILSLGLRVYSVEYELNKLTSDGINVPLGYISDDVMDEFGKLDGGGIDLLISFIFNR